MESDTAGARPYLSAAILQLVVDPKAAWEAGPPMDDIEGAEVMHQLQDAFAALCNRENTPDLVVVPELALPRYSERTFARLCEELGSIGIAGLDYKVGITQKGGKCAANEAVVVVPTGWPLRQKYTASSRFYVGKTFFAPEEEELLRGFRLSPQADPTMWLFDAGPFGRIAVVICYDLMDIERAALYRGIIQHLFVLALNQDVETFIGLAETLSRMTFCNVVICNSGYYGGSLTVSPYSDRWRRTIYEHKGQGLRSVQVVSLPVRGLKAAQACQAVSTDRSGEFKLPPPGFILEG